MDLEKTINELHQELERLKKVIISLEELESAGVKTLDIDRGRKSMKAAERRLASERMRKYWENRQSAR